MNFQDFINEGKKITLKRRYTENHPAVEVGKNARVRNKILEAIKDGKITQEEFNNILKEFSKDTSKWTRRNAKYFNVSEDGISLSSFGKRALAAISVNEGAICEATVEMDAMDPDNKDFLKFLKKHKVEIINKEMDGPGGGHPVITMQGKRKDLEKVLADEEYGWADPDLAEYIEESAVTENYEVIYSDGVSAMKKFRTEAQAIDFMKKTIASNKKLKNIAVYKPGMYSTTETDKVVMFWGDGSYLDNVSKKDPKLAAKKLEESTIEEGRAFVAAAKKAKDEGKDEFEFDGKTYPVTIKEKENKDMKNTFVHESFNSFVENELLNVNEAVNASAFIKAGKLGYNDQFLGRRSLSKTLSMDLGLNPKHEFGGGDWLGFDHVSLYASGGKKTGTILGDALSGKYTYDELKAAAADFLGIKESVNEAVNPAAYVKAGKLGYNDQFLGRKSLSFTLSTDLGLNPKDEFGGGDWLGFDHVSLYATGGKKSGTILDDALSGKYTYDELKAAAADFLGIKESIIESEELVNEAFGSMKLQSILTGAGSMPKDFAKAFYQMAKIQLDKIQDVDIIEMDPEQARKEKRNKAVYLYFTTNEKPNPYAGKNSWGVTTIPANTLLGVTDGSNEWLAAEWSGRWSKERTKSLAKTKRNDGAGFGKSAANDTWGSGISSLSKVAELADRAYVLDLDILRARYSTEAKRDERTAAKKGAVAFKNDKDFKKENLDRYHIILADRAAAMPVDAEVLKAIDVVTAQIKDGLAAGNKGKYGDVIIGKDPKGREIKLRDASNAMQNLLDDFNRYVDYTNQAKREEEAGYPTNYYAREVKNYAKSIKDRISKIEKMDYVW
jgi:hypothetical protein